jgi:transposase
VAAVPAGRDDHPVRTFRTFSSDLHQLADWLTRGRHHHGGDGVDGRVLDSRVRDPRDARVRGAARQRARRQARPGRKSDANDAQWLQQLHQHGLLRGSFRPRDAIVRLRAYLRHRERLVDYAAAHIQHMQKALMQMNVQLHHVVTDITGLTGMRIIRAIVAGDHAPEHLATFRDRRCHASEETIREALIGNYRPEHVFALRQALKAAAFFAKERR